MTNPLALIIEDDPKLAKIFSIALESAKFQTEIIPDGEMALARLAEITPSIVVLDLHLPFVSGEEILHHIHADDRLVETRIMLATAAALMAEKLRKKTDLVLLKPISVNQLRSLAQRLHPLSTSG